MNMPTGTYELPPLSDFTVTETVVPDANALQKISALDWVTKQREKGWLNCYWVEHHHGNGQIGYTFVIEAEKPTDVEVVLQEGVPHGATIHWGKYEN